MVREIDEMMKEIDDLKAENQRLERILESNIHTIESMAEGMCMLTHPNWTKVKDKDEMIQRTVIEWMERSSYERDQTQRSKRADH